LRSQDHFSSKSAKIACSAPKTFEERAPNSGELNSSTNLSWPSSGLFEDVDDGPGTPVAGIHRASLPFFLDFRCVRGETLSSPGVGRDAADSSPRLRRILSTRWPISTDRRLI